MPVTYGLEGLYRFLKAADGLLEPAYVHQGAPADSASSSGSDGSVMGTPQLVADEQAKLSS